MNDTVLMVFVLIGTVSAAISGAVVAINKRMDIFGVAILALVTSVGGGVIRDLILGITPPMTFRDPVYALTGIITSLFVFIPWVRHEMNIHAKTYELIMLLSDSLGLGFFTAVGVQTAYAQSTEYGLFLMVFVGSVTGVGGGVLRDLLAGQVPYIFAKRHLYASACVLGALVCSLLWPVIGDLAAMIICVALIFLIRVLAAYFKWKMPTAM